MRQTLVQSSQTVVKLRKQIILLVILDTRKSLIPNLIRCNSLCLLLYYLSIIIIALIIIIVWLLFMVCLYLFLCLARYWIWWYVFFFCLFTLLLGQLPYPRKEKASRLFSSNYLIIHILQYQEWSVPVIRQHSYQHSYHSLKPHSYTYFSLLVIISHYSCHIYTYQNKVLVLIFSI